MPQILIHGVKNYNCIDLTKILKKRIQNNRIWTLFTYFFLNIYPFFSSKMSKSLLKSFCPPIFLPFSNERINIISFFLCFDDLKKNKQQKFAVFLHNTLLERPKLQLKTK